MAGLAWAMKEIPTGTAYAVWVGIGATLALAYGMIFDGEFGQTDQDSPDRWTGRLRHWPKGS